jgi:hypothetical protein
MARSTHLALSSWFLRAILCSKELGLLGEMDDYGTEVVNMEEQSGTSFCDRNSGVLVNF